MLKSPDTMTLPEVLSILNSNCYLPASTKIKLVNRMKFLQHENNTKALKVEEFKKSMKPIILSPILKLPPKLKLQEDFPIMHIVTTTTMTTTTTTTTTPSPSAYSKQMSSDGAPNEDTKTILDYVNLKKIIEYEAVSQRIMVWFYDLSRRIYLLDAIRASHNKHWKQISNKFNYSKLLEEHSNAKEIIDLCDSLNGSTEIDFEHPLLQKYKHLTGLKTGTSLTTLRTKLDPKIKCDYVISLDKESKIDLVGLIYHKIIYYVDNPNIPTLPEYSDVTLREANVIEIERILNNSDTLVPYNHFICLSNPTAYVYLDIDSDLELMNVHPNVQYLSYLSNTPSINKQVLLKPYPNISKVQFSQSNLNTWKMDSYVDPALDLTYEEYLDLPMELQDMYTFEQTTWNSFTTDFVFNELLEYDKTNGIIIPKMRDAFMKLSYETTL